MDPDVMKRGNADRPFSPRKSSLASLYSENVLVLLELAYASYRMWKSFDNRRHKGRP